MILRISIGLALLLTVFFLPYYLTLGFILLGMVFYSYYWEGVLAALAIDLLYGVRNEHFWGIYFFFFFLGLMILFISEIMRKKIRHKNKYGLEI